MISQDRQREITLHVFDEEINDESVADLSIEETIFLVKEIERFKDNFPEDRFLKNHNKAVFYIIKKLREADSLYILMEPETKYPLIVQGLVQVFSEKSFAEKAAKHTLESQKRTVNVLEVKRQDSPLPHKLPLFAYFHYLGMERVIIDDGQTVSISLLRRDIFPAPDVSKMPPNVRPMINGPLQYAMIDYFQEVRRPVKYTTFPEVAKKKEEAMLSQIIEGVYLMPMMKLKPEEVGEDGKVRLEAGSKVRIAVMKNAEGMDFVPLFTDWPELERVYSRDDWAATILKFEGACEFGNRYNGFVINPAGCNFLGSKENIEKLMKFKEEKELQKENQEVAQVEITEEEKEL